MGRGGAKVSDVRRSWMKQKRSFLCFVQFSLASATRVAIIHIQFSSATPSRERRLFRTAFNGPSLYGPHDGDQFEMDGASYSESMANSEE